MNKSFTVIVCCIVLASVLSIPIALAAQPTTMYLTGHMDYTYSLVSDRIAGKNLIIETTEDTSWVVWRNGDSADPVVLGTSTLDPCRIHIYFEDEASFPPSTPMRFRWYTGLHIYEDFTIDGKTGTVVIKLVGKAEPTWEGTWMVVNSGSDLQGLTGQGTWAGPGGGYVEWEGVLRVPS